MRIRGVLLRQRGGRNMGVEVGSLYLSVTGQAGGGEQRTKPALSPTEPWVSRCCVLSGLTCRGPRHGTPGHARVSDSTLLDGLSSGGCRTWGQERLPAPPILQTSQRNGVKMQKVTHAGEQEASP